MRNCPRCLNVAVIEDGYCGHCRECTMLPISKGDWEATFPGKTATEVVKLLGDLLADKLRLDWLDGERFDIPGVSYWRVTAYPGNQTVRECIDAHLAHLPKGKA